MLYLLFERSLLSVAICTGSDDFPNHRAYDEVITDRLYTIDLFLLLAHNNNTGMYICVLCI